jgi:hypothetical protein
MSNNSMNKYSTSLAIRQIQIKTIFRAQCNPLRMAIIKYTQHKNADEDVRKILKHSWRGCKLVLHYRNQDGVSLKTSK